MILNNKIFSVSDVNRSGMVGDWTCSEVSQRAVILTYLGIYDVFLKRNCHQFKFCSPLLPTKKQKQKQYSNDAIKRSPYVGDLYMYHNLWPFTQTGLSHDHIWSAHLGLSQNLKISLRLKFTKEIYQNICTLNFGIIVIKSKRFEKEYKIVNILFLKEFKNPIDSSFI